MTDYICRRCWATVECICSGYEPPWPLNLAANLAAAGMAATLDRWSRYPCDDARCLACNADFALDTMREAVS